LRELRERALVREHRLKERVVGELVARGGRSEPQPVARQVHHRFGHRVAPRGPLTGRNVDGGGRLLKAAPTESPFPAFAKQLRKDRVEVERQFGNRTNWGAG
jgi:hypothetical protein